MIKNLSKDYVGPTQDLDESVNYSGKLTRRNARPTLQRMSSFFKENGLEEKHHFSWLGASFQEWISINPDWSQRAWEVLVLENLETILNKKRRTKKNVKPNRQRQTKGDLVAIP